VLALGLTSLQRDWRPFLVVSIQGVRLETLWSIRNSLLMVPAMKLVNEMHSCGQAPPPVCPPGGNCVTRVLIYPRSFPLFLFLHTASDQNLVMGMASGMRLPLICYPLIFLKNSEIYQVVLNIQKFIMYNFMCKPFVHGV